MAVDNTNYIIKYIPNGATTVFATGFSFLEDADIITLLVDLISGITTQPVLNVDYTVTGKGVPAGGSVTFVVAPPVGKRLILYRLMTISQLVDYVTNDKFPSDSVEQGLDRLTYICQQISGGNTRNLQFPVTDPTGLNVILPIAELRKGKLLGFDAVTGEPVMMTGGTSVNPGGIGTNELADGAVTPAKTANLPVRQDGRLTLVSGSSVPVGNTTGAVKVFYTQHIGDKISLWNGAYWGTYTFGEPALDVPATTNTLYDVFAFLSAGVPDIEYTGWSNSAAGTSARNVGLTRLNGTWVRADDPTRRYVGTFRTGSVAGQTSSTAGGIAAGGTAGERLLWNMYNQVDTQGAVGDSTNSWAYAVGVWRSANASAGNRVGFVCGMVGDNFDAAYHADANSAATGLYAGIGFNVTNALSGFTGQNFAVRSTIVGRLLRQPVLGYNFVQALEYGTAAGVFYGDDGVAYSQSGLVFSMKM